VVMSICLARFFLWHCDFLTSTARTDGG